MKRFIQIFENFIAYSPWLTFKTEELVIKLRFGVQSSWCLMSTCTNFIRNKVLRTYQNDSNFVWKNVKDRSKNCSYISKQIGKTYPEQLCRRPQIDWTSKLTWAFGHLLYCDLSLCTGWVGATRTTVKAGGKEGATVIPRERFSRNLNGAKIVEWLAYINLLGALHV